jgi:sugar lactone lactonase YvrE
MRLFFGEARCAVCHKGPNLSDGRFHNIGTADAKEVGRRRVTKKEKDHGAFRTPQMREVGRTAPYMHNGKFKTLAEVVQHYNFGGVTDAENEHRDEELRVLYLNDEQAADLVAFLSEGLTSRAKKPTRDNARLEPVSGIYHAMEVKASPRLTASGIAWWKDRLIIADRGTKKLRSFTPPDKFGEFKTLTHPVGVAVDPDGHLIVTEKEKDILSRVARFKQDGGEETLVSSTADVKKHPDGPGTPHFVAVHPNGTIYWSGFPDGGTRYLLPRAKKVSVAQPGIVHTYGIGLSPKHDWLYVSSKIPNPDRRGVWRFPISKDGSLGKGEFFIQIDQFETTHLNGLPKAKDGSDSLKGWVGRLQGLAVDRLGYLYVGGAESHTSGSAVAVFTPDGKKLAAMIVGVPRNVSGLAFGGKDGRTLFITGAGEHRLYQVRLPVPGEVFRD